MRFFHLPLPSPKRIRRILFDDCGRADAQNRTSSPSGTIELVISFDDDAVRVNDRSKSYQRSTGHHAVSRCSSGAAYQPVGHGAMASARSVSQAICLRWAPAGVP